jgi:4-amino-4-deoxy-L-arabinose transferase-like glycosyltransferase
VRCAAASPADDVVTARLTRGRLPIGLAFGALVALALVLRLLYIGATPGYELRHDARDYELHAQSVAVGEGYSRHVAYGRPTAFRPPGYPYFLAGVYRVAGVERAPQARRVHVARVAQAFVGTAVVALIGAVAMMLWGWPTGLVATALGAVYVPLITVGGAVMSEPLFVVAMLAALLAALAHRRSPHRYRYAVLSGVLTGLAILTRANGVVLLVPLAFAVSDSRPRRAWPSLGPPVALVAAAVLTVTPWTIRNAVELDAFVPVSTQLGSSLAGTYNDVARTDPENPGAWRSIGHVPQYASLWRQVRTTPEAVLEQRLRTASRHYIAAHPFYVAEVGFWNTLRMLDLDGRRRWRATAATITVDAGWADAGVRCFWLFALLAVAGAATAAARRAPPFVWAIPALLFVSVVFLAVETPRYRTALDPYIVLLAAVALTTAMHRSAAPPARSAPRRGPPRHGAAKAWLDFCTRAWAGGAYGRQRGAAASSRSQRQNAPAASPRRGPGRRSAMSRRVRSTSSTATATSAPLSNSSSTARRESRVKPPPSTARLRLGMLAICRLGSSSMPWPASCRRATASVPEPASRP